MLTNCLALILKSILSASANSNSVVNLWAAISRIGLSSWAGNRSKKRLLNSSTSLCSYTPTSSRASFKSWRTLTSVGSLRDVDGKNSG